MTDTSTKFDLDCYVPCQLATLTHSIMRSVAAVFEERFGISMPEWKVLAIIASKPSLSAVSVARLAQMDTVAVSRAVTKLMDRGLLIRDLDSEDRRRSVLNLSAEGLELHDQIAPLAKQLEANLLEDFSAEELQLFEKAIRVLHAKSRDFADAFTAPPRRLVTQNRLASGHATQDRYRPAHPAPLVGNYRNGMGSLSR
jgi:DNA-binding MarR family transcriptional regulator